MSFPFIRLVGCKEHNLKNISLSIPKNAITVITGVSGSGKSSLAFDLIFSEGQRRYLEYLSSQTRLWIKQMPKPNVDLIEGLSPTLAVGQRRLHLSSRGTVATYTDLYDLLALLYASVGEQYSPYSGKRLLRYTRQEITDLLLKLFKDKTRLQLIAPIKLERESAHEAILRLQQLGFIRLRINQIEWTNDEPLPLENSIQEIDVVVDRLVIQEGVRERLAASIETAMDLSQGILKVLEGSQSMPQYFTEIYVCPETNFAFPPLEPIDFNFNSVRGACSNCLGTGGQMEVNADALTFESTLPFITQVENLLSHVPKKIAQEFTHLATVFFSKQNISLSQNLNQFPINFLHDFLFPSSTQLQISKSVQSKNEQIQTTWIGLIGFLNRLLKDKKIKHRLEDLNILEWKTCQVCQGMRLKKESLACLIHGQNISELCSLTISDCLDALLHWSFKGKNLTISEEILPKLIQKLKLLQQVGLDYLQLNRPGQTLSDGEAQRIQLASQIGSQLSGLIYILDEPSLGLHRQDIQYLQEVIKNLKHLGNTVILVEHEKQLMTLADHMVELGPGAGELGGHLVFEGSYADILKAPQSLTGEWLKGQRTFPNPIKKKLTKSYLSVVSASLHNLHDLNLKIPLHCLVGFCGVSGSGKSSLAIDIIGDQVKKYLRGKPSDNLLGIETIERIILSQKPSDRLSKRSMPATYVDLMTPLRQLFAETRLAKARGYTAARFSLNKRGGRCEVCEGLGLLQINMQLMPDLNIVCDVCQGLRYNYETLQVTWENHTIADILNLSVEQVLPLFRFIPTLAPTLELMHELGLGYLKLGQPFHTLSGGEIQRLRLVADLATRNPEKTLYILDEPSAGLHFEDIAKLVLILHRLVERGHSVFIIEHHLELLKQADWIIEMGPGGGPKGGKVIFEGTVEKLLKQSTPTGNLIN